MNGQNSRHTGPSTNRTPRREPLTPAEARALLNEIHRRRFGVHYELALRSGIRHSELLALRWTDLDLDAGTLTISHELRRDLPNPSAKTLSPKTHPPRRIPLSQNCINILDEHRRRQRTEHGHAAEVRRCTGLVFTSGEGAALNHRSHQGQLEALCRHAGIRAIRAHDLRYSFIALLVSTDTPLKVIEALLSHHYLPTSADVTAGIRPKDLAQALEKLDTLLTPNEFLSRPTGSASALRPDNPAHDEHDDDQPPEPIGAPMR